MLSLLLRAAFGSLRFVRQSESPYYWTVLPEIYSILNYSIHCETIFVRSRYTVSGLRRDKTSQNILFLVSFISFLLTRLQGMA